MKESVRYILCTFFLCTCICKPAFAISFIRDAEIEHMLRTISTPIFEAANIPPDSVKLFIVNDPRINAFVAGGLNIFIHTGLIITAKDPGMLIGVIAHETGHISGAHLTRLSQQLDRTSLGVILSSVLGAAAIASGAGDAGAAILQGGQQIGQRATLATIRVNEQAADQAALKYLDANGISAEGMLAMFELLRRRETQRISQQDPYARTHPLNVERISRVRAHVEKSSIPKGNVPEEFKTIYTRARAKLQAFLEPSEKVFSRYPKSDNSTTARYSRAVAYFLRSQPTEALIEIHALMDIFPDDPFLYDFKGQILYEHGKTDDAIIAYATAHKLLPENGLIASDYGKSLLSSPSQTDQAIDVLELATRLDDSHAVTWRQLAIAYGKKGNRGMSHLALAEEAALNNKPKIIQRETQRALALLTENSPAYLRAYDLQRFAKKLESEG